MEFSGRNVNQIFEQTVDFFVGPKGKAFTVEVPYENPTGKGMILSIPEPVMVEYANPTERVLLHPTRAVNVFFQLYEALWMIDGQRNVSSLAYYNKKMNDYSDDGTNLNAAYGYRWREPYDQLLRLVEHLRKNLNSRRAVLSIWNVKDDLLNVEVSKDVACNLSVKFRLIENRLSMTVFNRSNDLVWGMLGSDVVCFSILHEWMAAMLGVEMGSYFQITDDLHIYPNTFHGEKWQDHWKNRDMHSEVKMHYGLFEEDELIPLIKNSLLWNAELPRLVFENSSYEEWSTSNNRVYNEPFFQLVAQPMFDAFHLWNKGRQEKDKTMQADGLVTCRRIHSIDWRIAAEYFMTKYMTKEIE